MIEKFNNCWETQTHPADSHCSCLEHSLEVIILNKQILALLVSPENRIEIKRQDC